MNCYSTMRYILPIQGTWGVSWLNDEKEWWTPGSEFLAWMALNYNVHHIYPGEAFVWSSHLGGTLWNGHGDWRAGARALAYYTHAAGPCGPDDEIPREHVCLLTHSHGLQVALYYAAEGNYIHRLLDISGPTRADMVDVAAAARPNIGCWWRIYSDWSDKIQWFGEWFDGSLNIERRALYRKHGKIVAAADLSVSLPGIGHSSILRDQKNWHHLLDCGAIAMLRS